MTKLYILPEGSEISFFSGSLLDKNPFHRGKMEYSPLVYVIFPEDIEKKKEWISVSRVQHKGFVDNACLNIRFKDLQPTNKICKYNHSKNWMEINDPDNPQPINTKEFRVLVRYSHFDKEGTMWDASQEHDVYARNKKSAINKIKKLYHKIEPEFRGRFTARKLF